MTLNPTRSFYGGAPGAPYKPATDEVVVIVDDSNGDPAYAFDDDGATHTFTGKITSSSTLRTEANLQVDEEAVVDGSLSAATVTAAITGAVEATRYAGGTAAIAPTTGTFAVGDFVIGQNGTIWICTVAGSPGTWIEADSATYAPKAAPTFTGHVTIPQGTAVLDAAALNQLTSALTITSGTLPNLGSWVSGTAKQNPVTRQITAVVEVVTAGTATTAACTIAISADNSTFTTVGTPGVSTAVNTIGAQTLVTSVTIPAAWYIKLTFSNCTVAASLYY